MRRRIIEAAVEEACSKRDSNGKEDQESCGNSDKSRVGIAPPREEWEDFAGAVEDKGDEDDPQYPTRSQAGHPVQADHGICQHQRWEPGGLHLELGEKKELKQGRNSPSFDAATGRRTAGECVACIRLCFIGPCQVQQQRRSRAQIQHEGGSRDFYPDHAGSACIHYAPLLRSR
jgi:hypothetical protein